MSSVACCPFCLSTDPNKVGVEKATGKVCRDSFHCPIPESHSDQPGGVFRYCQYCDYREADDPGVFIGSAALLDALYDTYVAHIALSETEGPDGPYLWCACGWRSDDLDGHGTRSDNPGMSYAVHLTNAQHAAVLQERRIRRSEAEWRAWFAALPDVGEHDWESIRKRVVTLLSRTRPDRDAYEAAYKFLASRADDDA